MYVYVHVHVHAQLYMWLEPMGKDGSAETTNLCTCIKLSLHSYSVLTDGRKFLGFPICTNTYMYIYTCIISPDQLLTVD